MSISLFDATVGCYLQTIPSILGCLDRARDHCLRQNMDCQLLVDRALHTDMFPLHFQIITLVHFSEGALAAAGSERLGGPDMTLAFTFDELQAYLRASMDRMAKIDPADVNALAGGEVVFQYGDVTLPFTTEDFFRTYATPNFYFHATTSYAILRAFGVPMGIANYIGTVKTTRSSQFSAQVQQQTGEEYLNILETLIA
ncbi:MAG: DUF1993 family protein [Cellvibrionales bacterium]|nr:DUF1993 domain-containing protein [Porticoccaceae bacterium]